MIKKFLVLVVLSGAFASSTSHTMDTYEMDDLSKFEPVNFENPLANSLVKKYIIVSLRYWDIAADTKNINKNSGLAAFFNEFYENQELINSLLDKEDVQVLYNDLNQRINDNLVNFRTIKDDGETVLTEKKRQELNMWYSIVNYLRENNIPFVLEEGTPTDDIFLSEGNMDDPATLLEWNSDLTITEENGGKQILKAFLVLGPALIVENLSWFKKWATIAIFGIVSSEKLIDLFLLINALDEEIENGERRLFSAISEFIKAAAN